MTSTGKPLFAVLAALAVLALLAVPAPAAADATPPAQSEAGAVVSAVSSARAGAGACTKLKKKAKKAKRAGNTAKKKALTKKYKKCLKKLDAKNAAAVRKQLSGYTFTGWRGGDIPAAATLTFCPNGTWKSQIESGSSVKKRWYVVNLDYRSKTRWTTQISDAKNGGSGSYVGMSRDKAGFHVGIAYFDEVSNLGPAMARTSGAAVCKTL